MLVKIRNRSREFALFLGGRRAVNFFWFGRNTHESEPDCTFFFFFFYYDNRIRASYCYYYYFCAYGLEVRARRVCRSHVTRDLIGRLTLQEKIRLLVNKAATSGGRRHSPGRRASPCSSPPPTPSTTPCGARLDG